MATVPNAAYMGGAGKLTIGADEYTAAITGFTLTPTAEKASVTDIGGGVTNFVGKDPSWVAGIDYNQDWTTADSFSQKLIEWHGQVKDAVYTPDAGGLGWAVKLVIEAGAIGGASKGIHAAQVSLGVNGQPDPIAPTP